LGPGANKGIQTEGKKRCETKEVKIKHFGGVMDKRASQDCWEKNGWTPSRPWTQKELVPREGVMGKYAYKDRLFTPPV